MPGPSLIDIPHGLSGDQLIQVLNDRLRAIQEGLRVNALNLPLDVQNTRIENVADPSAPQDALNLRSADARYLRTATAGSSQGSPQNTTTQVTVAAAGSLILTVPGVLAIESSAAALVSLPADQSWKTAVLLLKQAPIGGPVTVTLNAGNTQLGTVTIPDGASMMTGQMSWKLPKGQVLSLDVTAVGLTFPGADLTVELQP